MEIEIKPISLEARLDYLNTISDHQQSNKKKFPWGVAFVSVLIGIGIVYAIIQYKSKKEKKSDPANYPLQDELLPTMPPVELQAYNDMSTGQSLNSELKASDLAGFIPKGWW